MAACCQLSIRIACSLRSLSHARNDTANRIRLTCFKRAICCCAVASNRTHSYIRDSLRLHGASALRERGRNSTATEDTPVNHGSAETVVAQALSRVPQSDSTGPRFLSPCVASDFGDDERAGGFYARLCPSFGIRLRISVMVISRFGNAKK